MEQPSVLQYVIGVFVLACGCLAAFARNPVVSAMALMGTLFSTGALYFGLGAYFIGAVQILIYAGAISVLFVFVVMLLDLKPFPVNIPGSSLGKVLAVVAGAGFLVALGMSVLPGLHGAANVAGEAETAKAVSLRFLSKYMLPYQVTGLMILSAVVGVVVLGRPRKEKKA